MQILIKIIRASLMSFVIGIKLLAHCLLALTGQEGTELKKGQLFNKLRHTVDPSAISTLVEELHQLEKGRRHSEVEKLTCEVSGLQQ